jgi:hypothetical protein
MVKDGWTFRAFTRGLFSAGPINAADYPKSKLWRKNDFEELDNP